MMDRDDERTFCICGTQIDVENEDRLCALRCDECAEGEEPDVECCSKCEKRAEMVEFKRMACTECGEGLCDGECRTAGNVAR